MREYIDRPRTGTEKENRSRSRQRSLPEFAWPQGLKLCARESLNRYMRRFVTGGRNGTVTGPADSAVEGVGVWRVWNAWGACCSQSMVE